MLKTNSFESRLALVKNALNVPSTAKPPTPSDRQPQMHQRSPKKSNQCFDLGFENKKHATDQELKALRLWKSMIMMVGSFIERAPQSQQWTHPELREFITQVEICLELKPGKLSVSEYLKFRTKLEDIAPFMDGELAADLNSMAQYLDSGFENKKHATGQELQALGLRKSMLKMVESFTERAPPSQRWTQPELKEFITQVEICLELKPGKLSINQYANLMTKLDTIAPFKDGELATDLKSLDQIINAYGDKLATEG